jgi:hypothetical protein
VRARGGHRQYKHESRPGRVTVPGKTSDDLAPTRPTTLACMHGSAWRGDGAALLRALADALDD